MIIREASLEDAKRICEIYNFYVRETIVTFDLEEKTKGEFELEMKNILAQFPFYVAVDQDIVIGYAYAGKWKSRCAYDFATESSIYLDHRYQRKGAGSALYQKLIEELKSRKIHAVIGGISLPNEASIKLHEKFGFQKIAHFKEVGYKFDRWIDVGYWELILPFTP